MKNELEKQLEECVEENLEGLKELEIGSKEYFLASKAIESQVNARAKLDEAKSEKRGNTAKAWTAIGGFALALITGAVEFYKARNKVRINDKIVDREVNLMEQFERSSFDNK